MAFLALPAPLRHIIGVYAAPELDYLRPVGALAFVQEALRPWSPQDARADDNFALGDACRGGHLKVARWLVATFGLTVADVRARDVSALGCACVGGHLRVARWLAA